jgi:hypothetical protein
MDNLLSVPNLIVVGLMLHRLCHKPFCVNPSHVAFEPATLNIARNHYLRRFKCKEPLCILKDNPIDISSIPPKFTIGKALKDVLMYRLEIAVAKKLPKN